MLKRLVPVIAVILLIAACKRNDSENKLPQINPVQGTINADWGDTITIVGKNLPPDTKVYFGTTQSNAQQSNIISNNGSLVRCVVPVFTLAPTFSVYVQYGPQTTELTNYLTLNAPVISSFTHTQAIGDTVTITGDHFSNGYICNVNFGSASANIVGLSKKMLKVVVPDQIQHVHTIIHVTSQLQTVATVDSFTITKPVITNITPGALIGTKVTITGKYLQPLTTVHLDGVQVSSYVNNSQQIIFTVPYKTYPHRKFTVALKLLEYTIPYPDDINIQDNWVMVNQGVPFVAYNVTPLNVGSSVYVVAPEKPLGSTNLYLWRFNQADFSWAKVGSQITAISGAYSAGTDGKNIYLYNTLGPNTFYVCNPNSGVCTAKANFPGIQRSGAAMFSIDGKIYLGAGSYYLNNNLQSIDDWYAYTPGSDSWSRIADMRQGFANSYPMSLAQSVVINNTAYVVCGGWFFDYKYNASANTWSPMQNMLEPRTQAGIVVYNNKIYTLKGYIVQNVGNDNRDVFRYDPVSDQWQYVPFDIDPYKGTEMNFAFVTGGRIYMLSYNTYGAQENLYEGVTLP